MSELEIFRLRPYLWRICRDTLPHISHDEVDEIVRDVQVAVLARMRRGGPIDDIRSYAAKCARTACEKFGKRQQRERDTYGVVKDDQDAGDIPDRTEPGPQELVHARDVPRGVREALALLPEPYERKVRTAFAAELTALRPGRAYTDSERQARNRAKWFVRASARVLLHVDLDGPGSVDGITTCSEFREIVAAAHTQVDGAPGNRLPKPALDDVVEHLQNCGRCGAVEIDRTSKGMRSLVFLAMAGAAGQADDDFRLVSNEESLPGARRARPVSRPARAARHSQGSRRPRGRSYKGQALTIWTVLFLLGAMLLAVRPQAVELASELTSELAPYLPGDHGQAAAAGPENGRPPDATGARHGKSRPTEERGGADGRSDGHGAEERPPDGKTAQQPEQEQQEQEAQQEEAQPEQPDQPEQEQQEEAQPEQPEQDQPEQDQPEQEQPPQEQPQQQQEQQPQQPVVATPTYTLTVRLTGYGASLSAEAGGESLGRCEQPGNTGHECSWQVAKGAQVTLTAPDTTAEWRQGPCSGQSSACVFTLDAATTAEMYLYVPG
ncbi:hypothetical protein SMD20_22735 [Nonomuraea sp. LP-02]|uniref:RNA polymerase sigma factor n=1 Tax=Nonomuraea sp. LP-02 TaxID=3097960 RepID=UPI002E35D04F|nr:hypothetical protein [Nonomuraea sp. LP-02]MED7927091.1 hypothetical protein [Nonomuraea sp. LP-02]